MLKNNGDNKSVSLWEMGKVETIEEFYKRKFDWIPGNLRNEIGHFNIFKLPPYVTKAINKAYEKKYLVKGYNKKWVDGLCEPERVARTMEFIPV